MSDLLNNLGSIWYHSEPLGVPYFPNQFLGWDFFCCFLQQTGSSLQLLNLDWGSDLNNKPFLDDLILAHIWNSLSSFPFSSLNYFLQQTVAATAAAAAAEGLAEIPAIPQIFE